MFEQVKERITIKQAARILQIKPDTVYHHLENDRYKRVENTCDIDRDTFLEYIRSNYQRYAILAQRYKNIYERIYTR